jgi:hypothetical protein
MNGSLWSIISNACSDITSRVKWNGSINWAFAEWQGIRQGAETSTDLFNIKSDPLLINKLSTYPDTFSVRVTKTENTNISRWATVSYCQCRPKHIMRDTDTEQKQHTEY